MEWGARSELLDNLPGGVITFVGVGAGQVEVERIEGGLGKEIGTVAERFQIAELVFDEAMNGLDIARIGVCGGGNALVPAVAERGRETGGMAERVVAAKELGAVVGLPEQMAEIDAVAIQMALDASGEDGTGGGAAAGSEGQKQQAAADFARGVLDQRQPEALSLRPEARDVAEIFGVGGDLLEQPRRRLDPLLAGRLDETKAVVESVMHLSDQLEVGWWTSHGPPIVCRRGDELALPPASPS